MATDRLISLYSKLVPNVAGMRAREKDLFVDPFAEILMGEEGQELLNRALNEVGDQPAIAVRTRFIDDKVYEELAQGVRQIVVLAAGMDARAYRMNFPEGTSIFELDQEDVLQYKKEKLKNHQPRCTLKTVSVDLRDENWRKKLLEAGMKPEVKTLWMVEGLLMYLDEASVLNLFKCINTVAKPDSFLICDILGKSLLEAPHMEKQLQFLASLGNRQKSNRLAGLFQQRLGMYIMCLAVFLWKPSTFNRPE